MPSWAACQVQTIESEHRVRNVTFHNHGEPKPQRQSLRGQQRILKGGAFVDVLEATRVEGSRVEGSRVERLRGRRIKGGREAGY